MENMLAKALKGLTPRIPFNRYLSSVLYEIQYLDRCPEGVKVELEVGL